MCEATAGSIPWCLPRHWPCESSSRTSQWSYWRLAAPDKCLWGSWSPAFLRWCQCPADAHIHMSTNFNRVFFPSKQTKKTWFTTNSRIWRSYIVSATGWQQKTKLKTELLMNPFPWQQPQQFQWVHFSLAQDKDQVQCLCAGLWCWYTHRDHNQYDTACCYWDASLITLCTPFTLKLFWRYFTVIYCILIYKKNLEQKVNFNYFNVGSLQGILTMSIGQNR